MRLHRLCQRRWRGFGMALREPTARRVGQPRAAEAAAEDRREAASAEPSGQPPPPHGAMGRRAFGGGGAINCTCRRW
jgi:hypothetical protein